jgi:hypothetical protein
MVSLHDVGSREIRMEQCWNDTDRKTEASEIKLSEYYVVHHESHIVSSTEINITCEKIYFFFCVANKILHIGKGEIRFSTILSSSTFIFVRLMKN